MYDINVADEDEALQQVFNHGSSVKSFGFVNDTKLFALSHDEILSTYKLTTPDDGGDNAPSKALGDLRKVLGCEYVVQVLVGGVGQAVMIATGSHR